MGRIGGMVRRMKTKKWNHGRKTTAVIISAVLLIAYLLTLGWPFAAGVGITEERQEVFFRIWNPTLYPVSWSCQLLDEDGHPVSDEYLPAFEVAVKPLMKFGTKLQSINQARLLPVGNYTLRVTFRYDAWGKQKERRAELQFNA